MAASRPPRAPHGLGKHGKALWKTIHDDLDEGWELDARETDALTRACRTADELALLEAAVDRDGATVEGSRGQVTVHPALVESRQLRLAQLRLLSVIEMADPETAVRSTPAQLHARRAARVRHAKERRRG